MKITNILRTYGPLALFVAVAVLATLFGGGLAGLAFAALAPVVPADPGNPSGNLEPYDANTNPEGRPSDETLQKDEQGGSTQLQGKAASATDVRDAGLEAEDYDKDIVNFRKFRFPMLTYILNRCRPVKVSSYVHSHYRSGSSVLEASYSGPEIEITGGSDKSVTIGTNTTATKVFDNAKKTLTLPVSLFDNPECLTEFSTVIVEGSEGYTKDESGDEVANGALMLFVEDHKDSNENIRFRVLNAPTESSNKSKILVGANVYVAATACSESQIRVASETYLPEKHTVTLQKKNMTCIITDEFEEQDKKVGFIAKDVLANAMYNYKRKCARTHWLGTPGRFDIKVNETGNREAVYTENGILRQIPMLYTHNEDLTDDDMMAITALQFTENSVSDSATAFCGKREMRRIMKLVNSATHFKDVSKVEVNEYGIKVRKWLDNFGEIEFVYDPTLDDIGYQDYMVVLDLRNAVRYYKRNEKDFTQDMKTSGEAREAKAHNKSTIDCVALKGYNAVLVCPSSAAMKAGKLGGIQASFESIAALPTGNNLTAAAKLKRYYLTADDTTAGFLKGTVVEWDADLGDWKEFEGLIKG